MQNLKTKAAKTAASLMLFTLAAKDSFSQNKQKPKQPHYARISTVTTDSNKVSYVTQNEHLELFAGTAPVLINHMRNGLATIGAKYVWKWNRSKKPNTRYMTEYGFTAQAYLPPKMGPAPEKYLSADARMGNSAYLTERKADLAFNYGLTFPMNRSNSLSGMVGFRVGASLLEFSGRGNDFSRKVKGFGGVTGEARYDINKSFTLYGGVMVSSNPMPSESDITANVIGGLKVNLFQQNKTTKSYPRKRAYHYVCTNCN